MSDQASSIVLVVGLGNPGPKYDQTRHNAGFWFLDEIARRCGGMFRTEAKFRGWLCKCSMEGREVWLLKPETFMNLSGQSVVAFAHFYKIPPDRILVAHDELDLPVGTARLKRGGGHGGHNGLRSLVQHLGSNDFWRARIGIGHPGRKEQVVGYVLERPSRDDEREIEKSIDEAADVVPLLLAGEYERAMHGLHSK